MVQLGKDDLKGRHYPRGYAMWAVQHNKDWVQRIVTLRRSFHQSEPCEDQNKYICQRPAAALEGSESLGKFHAHIEAGRQNLRQLNCSFTTISSQFFGIYIYIFQKTEVQSVILRC